MRYLKLPQSIRPLAATMPLRILGMVANPRDLTQLDIQREKQRIEDATRDLAARGMITLTWLEGQTFRDLQRAIRHGPWHIFHFAGHGGFDNNADEGLVALSDENGCAHWMHASELGRLLADHDPLRLAVLNSCEGARGGERDVFSSTASILLRRGIPAVVAMQYEITDVAAVELARALYEALADGLPVDEAVAEARKTISVAVANTIEWGTPVLYMRTPDGVLFDLGDALMHRATPVHNPHGVSETKSGEAAKSARPMPIPSEQQPGAAAAARNPALSLWRRWLWPTAGGTVFLLALAIYTLIQGTGGHPPVTLTRTEGALAFATITRSIPAFEPSSTLVMPPTEPRATPLLAPTDASSLVPTATLLPPPTGTPIVIQPSPTTSAPTATATPTHTPSVTPAEDKIAFVSARGGNGHGDVYEDEVYIMNADGSDPRRLTYSDGGAEEPAWSPDGRQIAFRYGWGNSEIYVMNADGSDPKNLTHNEKQNQEPAWSPDGRQIAFVSMRDVNAEIYVMNADGSEPRRLTHSDFADTTPAWSPDGRQIAFESARDGQLQIYVMNTDGSGQRRVTNSQVFQIDADWSPDGRQIAYTGHPSSSPFDHNYEIYVMNADGSNPRRLTYNNEEDSGPTWSPDGRQIAFRSDRDGNYEIYVMNTDGSKQRRVTHYDGYDTSPAWSPMGGG